MMRICFILFNILRLGTCLQELVSRYGEETAAEIMAKKDDSCPSQNCSSCCSSAILDACRKKKAW